MSIDVGLGGRGALMSTQLVSSVYHLLKKAGLDYSKPSDPSAQNTSRILSGPLNTTFN